MSHVSRKRQTGSSQAGPAKPSSAAIAAAAPAGENRVRFLLLCAALIVLPVVAYMPALHGGPLWDDDTYVFNNREVIRDGMLGRIWFGTAMEQYYPLTLTAFWVQWRLWGQDTTGYHLVNVLLHGLAGILLWRCLVKLKMPAAWLVAAIFVVHPVNVPSVAWIAELKNALSGCLFFGSLLVFLRHQQSGRWSLLAASVGLFALALLSKTSVVILGPVLVGLIWWQRGRLLTKEVLKTIPYFVLAGAMGLVTVWFESHHGNANLPVEPISPAARLAGAAWAFWFYVGKILAPVQLNLIYPLWHVDDHNVLSYVPLALLAVTVAVAFHFRRTWGKYALWTIGYTLVALLPVLGFVDISFMRSSRVADHWLYLPMVGLLVAACSGAWALGRRKASARPIILGLGCIVLALLLAQTFSRAAVFASQETLWADTINRNPDCWLAWYNLGVLRGDQGRPGEAMADYERTLALNPWNAEAKNNMGQIEFSQGHYERARELYLQSLAINPGNPMCHNSMGTLFIRMGEKEKARGEFQKAVDLDPYFTTARNNLGLTYQLEGRYDLCYRCYKMSVEMDPSDVDSQFKLAGVLCIMGRLDESADICRLLLGKGFASPPLYTQLGVVLICQGQPEAAAGMFRKALNMDGSYRPALNGLRQALGRHSNQPGTRQ
jgi:tetratricopeptide (TPR) repeat protein